MENANFKTEKIIEDAIKSLKIKNSEGFDRVPQRILVNGVKFLIYILKMRPEQWLMSKITLFFKKGDKTNIINFRPVANLCALSKVFEKLVLKRIMDLEDLVGSMDS